MALLAIMAALAAAPPSASDHMFQTFQAMCISTAGDPTASTKAADRAGWTTPPEEALQSLAAGADDPKSFQARALKTSGGFMILQVDRSSRLINGKPLTENHCQLASTDGDYASVLTLAKTWAGVPAAPGPKVSEGAMFVFAEERGAHVAVPPAEFERATGEFLSSHRVTELMVYNLSRGPSLRLDSPVR